MYQTTRFACVSPRHGKIYSKNTVDTGQGDCVNLDTAAVLLDKHLFNDGCCG